MKIYPNSDIATIAAVGHPVFLFVENLFNEWYDHNTQPGAPMGKDIEGMYNGDADQPAIYSKNGAIIQAIEEMIDEADKTQMPVNISLFDVDACFE